MARAYIYMHPPAGRHLIPSHHDSINQPTNPSSSSSRLCARIRRQLALAGRDRRGMELELGLAPPTNTGRLLGGGKRGFGEAFGEDEEQRAAVATTLPLFDDGSSSSSSSESGGGVVEGTNKKALVGWPPVSSARSRACGGGGGGGRHVKVRKEGAAIGRKVDISLHGSYADLLATLARMFPDPAGDRAGCLGGSSGEGEMVVTYEDADGDWMLVGDVPWEDFARSVKRLKILL